MKKAQIVWNPIKSKFNLVLKDKVIVSSNRVEYLTWLVDQQKHAKILKAKITSYEIIAPVTGIQISDEAGSPIEQVSPDFDINERFGFLEELITLVIDGEAKSLVVSGEGGIGKTFTVMDVLKKAGKVDHASVMPSIEDLNIKVEDEEPIIEEKILAQINQPKGDYVVVKGHSSAKALYRILYEHRQKTIVFDDCDSVLKDTSAISLLKSALDSYEDRWVSWRIEQPFGESDLPLTFKFHGKIIFISNMPLKKIDDAVKTRCFKVDLSMTKPQRIVRMRSVIANIMPDVDMDHKHEALGLLEENLHITNDINFRSLMNLIMIRRSGSANWKKLGAYALTA
jgi:hypothetical protein